MKSIFRKINEQFYIRPILTTLLISFVSSFFCAIIVWVVEIIKGSTTLRVQDILLFQMGYSVLVLPFVLTIQNIFFLLVKPKTVDKERAIKYWEVTAVAECIFWFYCCHSLAWSSSRNTTCIWSGS